MKWHIPYEGREWVFDDSRITASEARLQKRVTAGLAPGSNGLAPAEADARRNVLDPDAWIAGLLIAMRREGEEDLRPERIDLDDFVLSDIVDRTLEVTRAELAKERADTGPDAPAPADIASVESTPWPAPA